MKKYFPKTISFILTFVVLFTFVGPISTYAQAQQAVRGDCVFEATHTVTGAKRRVNMPNVAESFCTNRENPGSNETWVRLSFNVTQNEPDTQSACGISNMYQCFIDLLLFIPGHLSVIMLKLAQWLTHLSGVVLNYVVSATVVNMKENLSGADGAINNAWSTVRDIANMGFIFILLYAAIMTIVGQGGDNKKLIVNIVIFAVLVNFSLFATKVVIDAANLLATTFYDAIAPGALSTNINRGLSNTLMEPLKLQSIYNTVGRINGDGLLVVGIAGTTLSLIAAFIFFAIAIMLVIRFVVLIFVLILSPLAFVSMALPQLKGYSKQWWDALIGQAFFAPIYFMLTWIVIVLSRSLLKTTGDFSQIAGTAGAASISPPPADTIGLLINFFMVIAMLVISITVAKSWANKAPGGVNTVTSWASGAFFGGVVGGAGRKTFGMGGEWLSNKEGLQRAAKEERGLAGAGARLALYASKKARSGTYDPRNATVPTNTVGHLIEGTLGRTKAGKIMGLDEVNIPSIPAGSYAATQTGVGAGTTGGYREREEQKKKRLDAAKKTADTEYREVSADHKITEGVAAAPHTPAYKEFEKALSKMSDKEVEAIVDSNKELLKKQEFANALSTKQLEAINKSDKFSDAEKEEIKGARFRDINSAMAAAGVALPPAAVTGIKALADAELEMIDPAHLSDIRFVSALRGGQVEAINKSNKFTRTQKNDLKDRRREPLNMQIAAAAAAPVGSPARLAAETAAQNELRKFSPKEITAMGIGVMSNSALLGAYTPNMLKRMASEMNTADIQALRTLLLPTFPIGSDTGDWLRDANTGMIDFS